MTVDSRQGWRKHLLGKALAVWAIGTVMCLVGQGSWLTFVGLVPTIVGGVFSVLIMFYDEEGRPA